MAGRGREPRVAVGEVEGRSLRTELQVFRVAQENPERLPESRGDALEGREAEIPLATFDEAVLGAVHLDEVRKRLLAPVAGSSVSSNGIPKATL